LLSNSFVGIDTIIHILIDDELFEDVGVALNCSSSCKIGMKFTVMEIEHLLDDSDHFNQLILRCIARNAFKEVEEFIVVKFNTSDCLEDFVHRLNLIVIHTKRINKPKHALAEVAVSLLENLEKPLELLLADA
jgi:hypothetical protein